MNFWLRSLTTVTFSLLCAFTSHAMIWPFCALHPQDISSNFKLQGKNLHRKTHFVTSGMGLKITLQKRKDALNSE